MLFEARWTRHPQPFHVQFYRLYGHRQRYIQRLTCGKTFRQIGHRRAAIRVRIFVSLGGKDHGYSFQSTRLKTDFNVLVGTSLLGCVVITNLDCTECLKLFFFVGRCPNEFVQGLRLQTVSAHDGGR